MFSHVLVADFSPGRSPQDSSFPQVLRASVYNETAPAGKEARQKVGAHQGVCQSSGTHLRQGSCVLSKMTFEALFYILAVLRMHWHRFSRGLFVTDVDSVSFYGVGVFF